MVDVLKIIFYLMVGIPFVYMAYDVFFHIFKNTYLLFSKHLKPAFVTIYTSLLRN
jgi:hypothetical protein